MDKKERRTKKSKKSDSSFLKQIAIAIPVLAGALIASVSINCIITNNTSTGHFEDSVISIIGLAVSVWAGINISNAIEKSSVDKAINEIELTKKNLKKMKKDVKNLKEIISEIKKANAVYTSINILELRTILETCDDIFYSYLGRYYIKTDSEILNQLSNTTEQLQLKTIFWSIVKNMLYMIDSLL